MQWPIQSDHIWGVADFFPVYPAEQIAVPGVPANHLLSDDLFGGFFRSACSDKMRWFFQPRP